MGKAEREKGKAGEREIAHILQAAGFDGARRTAQHCGRSGDASDVVGIPGLHLEVKRCETTKIHDWLAQAIRDSSGTGNKPVVLHRRSKEKWAATMLLDDFLEIVSAAIGYQGEQSERLARSEANGTVITRYNNKETAEGK